MTRPAEPEKKRELARRAVDVLRAEGVDIPIARLAEALDMKRPTLLYHFPTRGHIVESALEDLLTEQAIYVLAEVAKFEHPIERLYAQVRAVHAFHHGREHRIVFLTQAIAAGSPERMPALMDIGQRVFEPYRRALIEGIAQGIEEGTVAPCDPAALHALLRAVMDGLLVQRVMTGLDLAPVHALLWERVLAPLVITKRPSKGREQCSASTSGAVAAPSASRTGASSTRRTRSRRSSPTKRS